MTVLDLDPPQSALRLVSSNGKPCARDQRYRESALLLGDARALYLELLRAALEWRVAIDADALRVVLATKQTTSAAPARAFSATGIWQLMFVDVVGWCRNRQLDVPTGCAAALTFALQYLDDTESFHALSDPIDALLDAVDECTGGWADDAPIPSRTKPATTTSLAKARRSLRSERGSKRT